MHLQIRIVAAMLLVAVLAVSTGWVLLLGYLLAAFSIAVILVIMAGKMIKRIGDARLARPHLARRLAAISSRATRESQRRAA